MKRIVTIDVLRGVSIFLMTIFHTWTNVVDLSPIYEQAKDLSNLSPSLLIFAALFYILGHSRTFFLFLSAIIHQYNFMKKLERGDSPEKLLTTNLFKGIVVYLLGIIREGFFSPWGTINNLILDGKTSWGSLRLGYLFETLQIIGLSIMALSITSYIFFKLGIHKKSWVFFIYSAVMALVFIFPAPYLHQSVVDYLGYDIRRLGSYNQAFQNTAEYFTRFFWMSIAGPENPIFPNFGVTFIGGIFGYFLAKPKPSRKILNYGAIGGTVLLVGGGLYWVFVDNMYFDVGMRIHETWYLLANMGLQIYYVIALLAIFEFREKANLQRYARWSRFIRRWALVALTIYMIQYVDVFMRIQCTRTVGFDFTIRYFISKGWFLAGNPIQAPSVGFFIINFTARHQVGMAWSIFMLIVAAVYFDILLRLWEKIKFIGTWEWILIKLIKLFAGKKHYNSARIKVQESLYDLEPISFAQPKKKKKKKKS
ncbi:MAG: hypothetical protein ACTSQF_11615 [Candidatus Heimdallarchaeaceae archaeon]